MRSTRSARDRASRGRALLAPLVLAGALAPGCERREAVVRVESEREANRILVVLHDSGVASARKREVTRQRRAAWEISAADGGDAAAARRILAERNLPREGRGGLEAMVRDAGLVPTAADERARLSLALAGELERTLQAVEGVVEARVHLVLPARDALGLAPPGEGGDPPSATVLIKHALPPGSGESPAPPISPEDARTLVAGGVEGLSPQRVTVVYTGVRLTGAGEGPGRGGPALDFRHRVLAATTVAFALALLACAWLLWRATRRLRAGPPPAARS